MKNSRIAFILKETLPQDFHPMVFSPHSFFLSNLRPSWTISEFCEDTVFKEAIRRSLKHKSQATYLVVKFTRSLFVE